MMCGTEMIARFLGSMIAAKSRGAYDAIFSCHSHDTRGTWSGNVITCYF